MRFAHAIVTGHAILTGGPAGGNGGSGGNVWVQADSSLNSLTTFRKQVHYRADSGRPGGGSNMTGANAEDLIIKVSINFCLSDMSETSVHQRRCHWI